MLVFIDESGDPGWKIKRGSSRFFIISLVIFNDQREALNCDRRINLLRKKLGWNANGEFHFKRNSNKVRRMFLTEVARDVFFYYGIIINKDPIKLWGDGFKNKQSFYKYACNLVFQNAQSQLEDSVVVIDESGNLAFKRQLAKYLRAKLNTEKKRIVKRVKMQRSRSNNLLQLADYVAGAINRSVQKKRKWSKDYRKIIAHREIYVQIWPKQKTPDPIPRFLGMRR